MVKVVFPSRSGAACLLRAAGKGSSLFDGDRGLILLFLVNHPNQNGNMEE